MKIVHNGKEIGTASALTQCKIFDRYGGMLDNLTLAFPHSDNTLTLSKFDEISVSEKGFNSGVMYLDDYRRSYDSFLVNAVSCLPTNKVKKNRIWLNVRLLKIIGDISVNCGLSPLTYGVEDYAYKCLSQTNQTDLEFLAMICEREGYSVKCDNGNLIVFNERLIENESKALSLSSGDVSPGYTFSRSINGLRSVKIAHYSVENNKYIESIAEDGKIDGGGDLRLIPCDSVAEAARYAKGLLRAANKNHITGSLSMEYNPAISAATCLNLTGFDEFNGRYVVTEAAHDLIKETTTIKIRRTLDY